MRGGGGEGAGNSGLKVDTGCGMTIITIRIAGLIENLGRDNGIKEPYRRLYGYSHFEHDTAGRTHRLIVIWTCYLEIISLLLSLSVFDRLTSADMRPSCSHGEKKLLGETSYTCFRLCLHDTG